METRLQRGLLPTVLASLPLAAGPMGCNLMTGADGIEITTEAGGGTAGEGAGGAGPGGGAGQGATGGTAAGGAGGTDTGGTGGTGGSTSGPFATCGSGGPTGEHQLVTLSAGEYLVWAPVPNPAAPHPLVLALHGDEGHPDQAVSWIWSPVWDAHQDFVFVAPVCPGAEHSWYQGDPDAHAAFIGAVLADVASHHNVDILRAYAIGYSGGSCFWSFYAFDFQDVFAAVQWSCGGCSPAYAVPPRADCKVDGRFHIAADDFLLAGAEATADAMRTNGHEVEWVTAPCSGHCCANTSSYAEEALGWFLGRTKCDSNGGAGCAAITALP